MLFLFCTFFVCVCCVVSLCLFLSFSFLWKSLFPCNSSVFRFNVHSISVSHFSLWFLLFVFVLFAMCFKRFLCFCYSACCLVLFWTLHLLFLFCFLIVYCFGISYFWLLATNQKHPSKIGNSENPKPPKRKIPKKKKKKKKTDILTRAISTGQIVCVFLFCVSLNFVFLAENNIKVVVPAKTRNSKLYVLNTGPSINSKLVQVCCVTLKIVLFLAVFLKKSSSFCRFWA